MKIRKKLYVSVLLLAVTLVGSAAVFAYYHRAAERAIEDARMAEQSVRGIFELNMFVHDYIANHDARAVEQWQVAFRKIGDVLFNRLDARDDTAEERALIARLRNNHVLLGNLFDKLATAHHSAEAEKIVEQSLTMRISVMIADLYRFSAINNQVLIQERESFSWALGFSFLISVGLGLFIIMVNRRILVSLGALHGAADRIGEGDFATPVVLSGRDEFATLAKTMNAMSVQLQRNYQELRQSEERFRLLFNSGNDVIWLYRADPATGQAAGNFIEVNDVACRRLGYGREDFLGMGPGQIELPAEGKAASLAANDWVVYETVHAARDGRRIPVEINARKIADRGETLILAIARDITERKAAQAALAERERLYHQMFNNNPAIKLLIDFDTGGIVDANPAAAQFYGWPVEVLRTMGLRDVDTRPADQVEAGLQAAAAEPRVDAHLFHRQASGEIRTVEFYTAPLAHGGRTLIHAVVFDVTERERYQQQMEQAAAELSRSNSELEQFAYVASHDLREPLRTVSSFLTLLERHDGASFDDEGRQYIDFAREGAKRMDRLILDLLEYSRIGRMNAATKQVDLGEQLAQAVAALDFAVQETQSRIEVLAPLPIVTGNPDELMRLFQNLIGNAIKYRRPDLPPVITVSAQRDGDNWLVRVTDNGIGIAPEYFQRIFGLFQRLHTRSAYEGTGIGLANCKKIVEHHGGRIWVESEPGLGSTFCFTLPVRA